MWWSAILRACVAIQKGAAGSVGNYSSVIKTWTVLARGLIFALTDAEPCKLLSEAETGGANSVDDNDLQDLKGSKVLSTEAKNILSDLELDLEESGGCCFKSKFIVFWFAIQVIHDCAILFLP